MARAGVYARPKPLTNRIRALTPGRCQVPLTFAGQVAATLGASSDAIGFLERGLQVCEQKQDLVEAAQLRAELDRLRAGRSVTA